MKTTERLYRPTKKTSIILYGAAAAGLRAYHSLCVLNGYSVVGFFDKRAHEVKQQNGLPVWSPEQEIPYDKTQVVVFVCVKNVFDHAGIARALLEKGYCNLIFKPMFDNELTGVDENYQKVFHDVGGG